MPCFCHYDPPEKSKKLIKLHCQIIVDEIKRLSMDGDPIGFDIESVITLIRHLNDPPMCNERGSIA